MGLTTTAVGHTAPIAPWSQDTLFRLRAQILSFLTGDNPQYQIPQNSMQLRITFTNSSILAPAFVSFDEDLVQNMTYADQTHEASQSVCGRLFLELHTDLEPVASELKERPSKCWRWGRSWLSKELSRLRKPLNG